MQRLFLSLLLVFFILLSVFSATINVTSCPATLNSSGDTYQLIGNITSSNDTCVTITDNNIIFDGNGFSITNTGGTNGDGVAFTSDADDSLIENISISGFTYGLSFNGTHAVIVKDSNFISNTDYGVYIFGNSSVIDINNIISSGNGTGVFIEDSLYNSVTHSKLTENDVYGIHNYNSPSPTTITDNNLENNGSFGLYFSGDYLGACWGDINRNTISGGNAYVFNPLDINSTTPLSNLTAAYIFLCGISDSDINFITINPTDPRSGGLVAFHVTNTEFLDVNVSNTDNGFFTIDSNDNTFVRVRVTNNFKNAASGFHLNGNNNWVTEGTFSNNNDNGLTVLGSGNLIQYTIVGDNNYDGVYISGPDNNIFDIRVSGNKTNGISLISDNANLTWSEIYSNSGAGLYVSGAVNQTISNNTIYENSEAGIYAENTTGANILANSISDETQPAIWLNNVVNSLVSGNNISDSNTGIFIEEDTNTTLFSNSIFDMNGLAGIYSAHSIDANIYLNQIENALEKGIYLFDSNNATILLNTINLYGGTTGDYGVYLDNSYDANVNNNHIAFVGTSFYVFESSTSTAENNYFYNPTTAWFTMTSGSGPISTNNTFSRNTLIDINYGSFKTLSPITVTGGFTLTPTGVLLEDNNISIDFSTVMLLWGGTSAIIEFANQGIISDVNIYHNGSLCAVDCNAVSSQEEGKYQSTVLLSSSGVSSYSLSGEDANSLTVNISSPTNGATINSSTVTIDYNAVPLYNYFSASEYFTSTDGINWTSNGTSTSKTFSNQHNGSRTYYVFAQDSSDRNSNIASVTVNVSLSSGSSGSGSSGGTSGGSVPTSNDSNWTKSINLDNNLLKTGIDQNLGKNERLTFAFSDENHSIGVTSIDGNVVTLLIESTPITSTFSIGQTKEFSINGDAINDISITLLGITNNKANIFVKLVPLIVSDINTSINDNNSSMADSNMSGSNLVDSPSNVPNDYTLIIVVLILLILGGVVIFYQKKKLKKK